MSDSNVRGRCGPLCQHPGCWYSAEPHKKLPSAQGYTRYVANIISKHSIRPQQEKSKSNEGLPALTVQSLDNALPMKDAVGHRRGLTSPSREGRPMRGHTPSHSFQKVSFSEMVLEEDNGDSGSTTEYTVTPVLIWRPGRREHQKGKQEASKLHTREALNVMNLADQVCLEEHIPELKFASVKPKVRRRQSRTVRSSADNKNYSYLQDIPPHIIKQLLEHLRSASSASLGKEEERCDLLLATAGTHQQTSLARTQKDVAARSTSQTTPPLPPLTPQTYPRPLLSADNSHFPPPSDHSAQPTPLPVSVVYDLLTQMLWTTGAQPLTPRGYSRMLADRPHDVLKGHRRPLERPTQDSLVAMTTLTLPECMAMHHTGIHSTNSSKHLMQTRYPYGNPVLHGMSPKHCAHGEYDTPAPVDPKGCKGQLLEPHGLLSVSSYQTTPREPKADPPIGKPPSISRTPHTIRVPNCPEVAPTEPVVAAPGAQGCKTDGPGQQVGACQVDVVTVAVTTGCSPDHTMVGAHLEEGQLLLLDNERNVVHQIPADRDPEAGVKGAMPGNIQQVFGLSVVSDNQGMYGSPITMS